MPNVLLHLPEANNIAPQVRYYATGYTADLFVRARIDGKRIDMIVAGEVSSSAPVSLLFYEMYDWVLHRWVFVAFDQLAQTAPGQETPIGHFIPNPQRFISPSKNAYIRLYLLVVGNSSISTGGLSNNATPLVGPTIRFDWIGITADPSVGGIFGIE